MAKNISNPDIWQKLINKLNRAKLPYILVGAAALVIYGLPRSTLDIDIYVPASKDILCKLFQIARGLGLKSEEKGILKIGNHPGLFANQWVCFSHKSQDILDVFFAGEAEFTRLYKHSKLKQGKGITVRVASLSDLKTMKKASGRPQDLADIKLIEEIGKLRKNS